jgi:transposase
MRGSDERSGELFSYVDLEDRVPAKHPLRLIRRIVNEVLVALDCEFTKLHADTGRPSIPPERLLRALLLQAFYTIRSETQLMEQLHYNLLCRWFVGLGVDVGADGFHEEPRAATRGVGRAQVPGRAFEP